MVLLAKSNIDVLMEKLGINEFMPNGGWVNLFFLMKGYIVIRFKILRFSPFNMRRFNC